MFKIGLENRDFCKSLHFYIVDAEKKKKKKKRAASAGLFSCSRPFGPRASPGGRCPHYLFFLCCGALASALINLTQNKMNLFVLSGHGNESFAAFLNEVILQ